MAHDAVEIQRILRKSQGRNRLHVDLVSHTRSLYRVYQLDGQRQLPCVTATSPRHTVVAVIPDEDPATDRTFLVSFPACYRWPAYHLDQKGYAIDHHMSSDDLLIDVSTIHPAAFDGSPRPETISA